MEALKILVVDDDMMCRQMAEFILKQGGHDVHLVQSGDGAISALERNDFALVLLDVDMPGKNGVETLKAIRKMPGRMNNVPVIFLTADASPDTVTSAASLNAAGYIKKPFLPQDLLARVDKVLISNTNFD